MPTKKCSKCKIEQPLSAFCKNKSKIDGYNTFCKECNKIYLKQHYKANKSLYVKRNKLYKPLIKNKMLDILSHFKKGGCIYCVENCIDCIDCHHIKTKKYAISEIISKGMFSAFVKEIIKCVPLCSNCHRKLHKNLITLDKMVVNTHMKTFKLWISNIIVK